MTTEEEKKSFLMFTEWAPFFESATDEQAGDLIKGIFAYVKGEEPELKPATVPAYAFIVSQIDKNFEKWEEAKRQKKEAGRLGGLAKASRAKQNLAEPSTAKQCQAEPSRAKQNLAEPSINVNVNVNDNVSPNGDIKENTKEKQNDIKDGKPSNARFIPPTVEEVREYCQSRNNFVDPEGFVNFYTSNGWKVGKNPMKNWKAAVVTWEKRTEKLHRDTLEKINATKEESDEEFFAQMFKEAAIYDEQHSGSNFTAIQPSLPGSIF